MLTGGKRMPRITHCGRELFSVMARLAYAPSNRPFVVCFEWILSPHNIHFASVELYSECKSYIACECSSQSLRSMTTPWETCWRKAQENMACASATTGD